MRIYSDPGTQLSESSRATAKNSATPEASSLVGNPLGQDLAQLSSGHAQIQALAAQAARLPEVRTERVSALREAVRSGNYNPAPQTLASAVFSHLIVGKAA